MKHYLSLVALLVIGNLLFGQTLFTYGNKTVSKNDFLTAFNRNPPSKEDRRKALDEYLGLYINYKLKVQAGYDEELNKQPSFKDESKNFKKQIADNVINEEAGIQKLTKEAVERSRKDIRVSQVFIEVNVKMDSVKAYQLIQEAYKALQAGADFGQVAAKYSTDEGTKRAKGDIGNVTAFTLSYNFENEIYKLKPGTYSKPFKSSFGYHIFKDVSERPALGKRKIAQIRIATPKGFSKDQVNEYSIYADSIYNLLKKGASFEKLVHQISSDIRSVPNDGVIGWVSVGDYDADFEKPVFSLQNVGDISKPFATVFGYHIIKLIDKKPALTSADDADALSETKQIIEKDERLAIAKKNLLYNKWLPETKFKQWHYDSMAFKQYTDSNILNKITNGIKKISDTTVLFSFERKKIYSADWAVYIAGLTTSPYADYTAQMKKFIENNCTQYYTDNLELYSEAMKAQCKEFDEANVLFAAMDRHVWSKSATNPEELKEYFNKHKEEYFWKESANAIVVNCKTQPLAALVANKLKQAPDDWHNIATTFGADVTADSGRFEITQFPLKQPVENKDGWESVSEKNTNSDNFTFVYILQAHPQKEQRNFEDAKGAVTNDYQQILEKEWIAFLKKKYPIKVNQAVWNTIE